MDSIAISLLVSRPRSVLGRRNIKRNRILNDQVFLNFNFMYWFGKIWLLLGVFSYLINGFDYVENLMIPSVLLLIVLYLESWKTLAQVIKSNRFRIQLFHFLTLVILTIGLSKLNVVDYESFDESMLSANPNIEVPSSLYEYDNNQRRYYDDLIFKMEFDAKGKVILMNSDNKQIQFSEIYNHLKEWTNQISEELKYRFSPKIRANKDIPIEYIKQFEFELYKSGRSTVIYEVENRDEITMNSFNKQIKHWINNSLKNYYVIKNDLKEPLMPPLAKWWYDDIEYQDTLRINISDKTTVNGKEMSLDELFSSLKKYISESTVIEYIYDESATYQDYIDILSTHKQTILELRNTEDFKNIDEEYYLNRFNRDEKLNKERRCIMDKYPFQITEKFE